MSRVLKHLLREEQPEIDQEEFEKVELEMLQGGKLEDSSKFPVENPATKSVVLAPLSEDEVAEVPAPAPVTKVQLTGNYATDSITELKNSARLERVDLRVGPMNTFSTRKNEKEKVISPPPFHHHQKSPAARIVISVLLLIVCSLTYLRFKRKPEVPQPIAVAPALPSKAENDFLLEQALNRDAIKLFHSGKYEEAVEKFQEISKKHPESSSAHTNLGMTHFKLGDAVSAKHELLTAVSLNSKDVIAFNNLGIVSISDGDHFTAVSYFEKAIQVSPSFPDSHLNLGKTYEQMGKPEKAIVEYKVYVGLPTADPVVSRVVSKRIVKLSSISRYFDQNGKEAQE